MSLPTTRAEFIEYCLRRLGKPVSQINVASQQLDDRVDETLQLWTEFHYHAQHKTLLKHELTEDELTNKTIEIPEEVQHIVKVFTQDWGVTGGMFSLRYQLSMNDLWDLSSTTLSNYVISMQYLSTIGNVLTPESDIVYQHHTGQLVFHPDIDQKWTPGTFIIIEAYIAIDPETYPGIWKDRVLLDYGTAVIKRQWGENLKKFSGIQMPGGTTLNGQQIYDEAIKEIEIHREQFINMYQEPPMWQMA